MRWRRFNILAAAALLGGSAIQAQVCFNELMYHPVELPAFDTNGVPVLDISDDVHEFIELHNPGQDTIRLDHWRISGGVDFEFPPESLLGPGGFIVVAKNPARLAAIPQYGLAASQVLGPHSGQLSNSGDTLRLRNARDELMDSVTYSAAFPWAINANALGAEDDWTGLNSFDFQYRGRSLERVSPKHSANDPANWLASPLATGPTPGRPNTVVRPQPLPIVVALSVAQAANGSTVIRSNQPVKLEVGFSAASPLAGLAVEYFLDDVNRTNETWSSLPLLPIESPAGTRFTATLPGAPNRSIVRYRIHADRGAGDEVVSPRADDPFAWHAYFVTPQRTSPNPIYECFISSASLNTLATNINQSPRRVANPDPPGWPRASWNATRPAIVVIDNEVIDIQMRHHGSRYRRDPGRGSYKWKFPRYHRFQGRENIFITDKGEEHRIGHGLYAAAGLPTSRTRFIDLYLNNSGKVTRLEQEEMDDALAERWAAEQAAMYPGTPYEAVGEFYKSQGVIPSEAVEGPYGIGNCQLLEPRFPWWTELNRYEWTYSLQMHGWKGHAPFAEMLHGLWAARGDTPARPGLNMAAVREFLAAHFDVDATLTYIALRNWGSCWDNATHNYFLWRRANGKWAMLPWDFDSEFGETGKSIYWDEQTNPQPDTLRGPQWIKDAFLKAYREEYKQKLFLLNNTLLNPTNITALGFGSIRSFANGRFTSVNQQLGLGVFHRPLTPTNQTPVNNAGVLPPAFLTASPYRHSDSKKPAHASTTWLIRHAGGTYRAPVARITSTNQLSSLPIPFAQLAFGERYFWRCFYTDTNGHPSPESAETAFVFGGASSPGMVVLSEILAENRGSATNGWSTPDYIELRNLTNTPLDLSQMSLSDNPERPGKFLFPAGTSIPPSGYLVVWCDDATNAPGLHAGFALDNDGQTVALFNVSPNGYQLTDTVTFGLQAPDKSIARRQNDSGWVLAEPTPGAANVAAALGAAQSLKINEWMASSTEGPDWLELHNAGNLPVELSGLHVADTLSGLTNSRIPALSFIGPGGFQLFLADQEPGQGAHHLNFKLSGSGDSIYLSDALLTILDTIHFGPQTPDVSEGRWLDGGTNRAFFPGSASPGEPNFVALTNIVISEVLSRSTPPFEDAIELQNLGPLATDLGGWWLSDSLDEPRKFQIPRNTVLPPSGFIVFQEHQFGGTNSPRAFSLNGARGDEVYLSAVDAQGNVTGFRTSLKFDAAASNVSLGRVPVTAGVDVWAQATRTLGASNGPPLAGPVVISEIQFQPPDFPGDNEQYEYLELANLQASPVDLFEPANPIHVWRLRDAVDFAFPPLTSLASGERVLIVPFDPVTNATAFSNFLAVYSVPSEIRLFGPWTGKLDNAGEPVELVRPDAPLPGPGPEAGYIPVIQVDRVRYADHAPWPAGAEGTGASLQRRSLAGYGNEPANWFVSGVSPGLENTTNAVPAITLLAPGNLAVFPYGAAIQLTAVASDSDGYIRLVEFFADGLKIGQAGQPPFTLIWANAPAGTIEVRAIASDDRLGFAASETVTVIVSNQAPQVRLTAPAGGSTFLLPTNIFLEAAATDADGAISRVEFLADGVRLGEDQTPPYTLLWANAGSGIHVLTARATDTLGTTSLSEAVFVTNSRATYIAYQVPLGVAGSQSFNGGLGMDFEVLRSCVVLSLGVFDSGADGIDASSTLSAQIFRRNGNTGTLLGSATFNAASPGTLVESSRFKPLATPLLLAPGAYTIAAYGFNGQNRNGNPGTGDAKTWTVDDGGGILKFVGTSRYNGNPGTLPPTPDSGPADRYAAGTFEFVPAPERPQIFGQPTNLVVRAGQNAAFRVMAAGQEPLVYQWFFGEAAIPGGTNALLTLPSAQEPQAGAYYVVVSNRLGTAKSAAALLDFLREPLIVEHPVSQSLVPGAPVVLSISVTNNATLPLGYRLRRNGLVLPASMPGAFLTLTQYTAFFMLSGTNVAPPWTNYAIVVTNAAKPSGNSSGFAVLTYLADADQDGLPDAWELAHGFPTNSAGNALLDADGDGLLNRHEYWAGTDPTNSASYLRAEMSIVDGGIEIVFSAISNRTYTVEYSDALIHSPWTKFADVPAATTNRAIFLADPALVTNRYYRVATPRQP